MASFQPFKITNVGLNVQYKAQTGKELKFTKFILGDGTYTGSIRDLTSLVSPKESVDVKRLKITGTGSTKKVIIGFDIDTSKITTGFYLREIGLYAKDPDTNQEILVFYTNAGDGRKRGTRVIACAQRLGCVLIVLYYSSSYPSPTELKITKSSVIMRIYISAFTGFHYLHSLAYKADCGYRQNKIQSFKFFYITYP